MFKIIILRLAQNRYFRKQFTTAYYFSKLRPTPISIPVILPKHSRYYTFTAVGYFLFVELNSAKISKQLEFNATLSLRKFRSGSLEIFSSPQNSEFFHFLETENWLAWERLYSDDRCTKDELALGSPFYSRFWWPFRVCPRLSLVTLLLDYLLDRVASRSIVVHKVRLL